MLDWIVRIFDYAIGFAFIAGCVSAIVLSLRPGLERGRKKIVPLHLNRPGAVTISPKSPHLRPEDARPETAGLTG